MKGKQFLNFLSYVAVALIALALVCGKLLGWILNPNIVHILTLIAECIAYLIVAIYGFIYAKSKKNKAWIIVYIVCIVLIILFTSLVYVSIFKG